MVTVQHPHDSECFAFLIVNEPDVKGGNGMLSKMRKAVMIGMAASGLMMGGSVMVSAEETEGGHSFQVQFFADGFGISPEAMISQNERTYVDRDHQPVRPFREEMVLKDGTQALILSYQDVLTGDSTADLKYYFLEDQLCAMGGESADTGYSFDEVVSGMNQMYGAPFRLELSQLGSIAEMAGEGCPADGQDAWRYEVQYEEVNPEDGTFMKNTKDAVGTVWEADGQLHLLMFVAPPGDVRKPLRDQGDFSALEGFDDLNAEEKEKFSQYYDFLQYQLKEQAEQYIAYLRKSRETGEK